MSFFFFFFWLTKYRSTSELRVQQLSPRAAKGAPEVSEQRHFVFGRLEPPGKHLEHLYQEFILVLELSYGYDSFLINGSAFADLLTVHYYWAANLRFDVSISEGPSFPTFFFLKGPMSRGSSTSYHSWLGRREVNSLQPAQAHSSVWCWASTESPSSGFEKIEMGQQISFLSETIVCAKEPDETRFWG